MEESSDLGTAEGDVARLRQLVGTCQDAVLFIDRMGTITQANPATCRMFGYDEAELLGADVRMLMAEPYASHHRSYVDRFESSGEKRAIGRIRQVSAMRRGGEEFPIELSVTQLAGTEDSARYGAFIRDVSDKMRLQSELMERERAATVGTTASMLVHEIGNPLNNMGLQLQALRRHIRKTEEQGSRTVEKVDACLGEVERLSRLVQEFRALSGRRRLVKRRLRVTELVEAVLINMMRVNRGISVVRHFDDDGAEVSADPDKLQQVFLNLFHNAAEAMPNGGTLTLQTSEQNGAFVIVVTDTGEGVPEGIEVFEPFVTSKDEGTGLGLAICSEIVREHDGRLSYESTRGEGTSFRMTIPLAAPPRD